MYPKDKNYWVPANSEISLKKRYTTENMEEILAKIKSAAREAVGEDAPTVSREVYHFKSRVVEEFEPKSNITSIPVGGFDQALQLLKNGKRVARAGWNGKGMFLVLVPGSEFPVTADRPFGQVAPELIGQTVKYQSHVDMYTAQGTFVPWLASQADLLSEDWELVV